MSQTKTAWAIQVTVYVFHKILTCLLYPCTFARYCKEMDIAANVLRKT